MADKKRERAPLRMFDRIGCAKRPTFGPSLCSTYPVCDCGEIDAGERRDRG